MHRLLLVLMLLACLASLSEAQAPVRPITANELLPRVETFVKQKFAVDAELLEISFHRFIHRGVTLNYIISTGSATGWLYRYRSPSSDLQKTYLAFRGFADTVVEALPDSIKAPTFPGSAVQRLGVPWVDDPVSMSSVRKSAQTFLTVHPTTIVSRVSLADNLDPMNGFPIGKSWTHWLAAGTDTLRCVTEAVTAVSADCAMITTIGELSNAQATISMRVTPHPLVTGSVAILRVGLREAGSYAVHVRTLLGRRITTIPIGFLRAGENILPLRMLNLPAGLYDLQLVSDVISDHTVIIVR